MLKFFDVDPDPGSGAFLTPGSEMEENQDKYPGSYCRELSKNCFGKKCLNSLLRIRIRNPVTF